MKEREADTFILTGKCRSTNNLVSSSKQKLIYNGRFIWTIQAEHKQNNTVTEFNLCSKSHFLNAVISAVKDSGKANEKTYFVINIIGARKESSPMPIFADSLAMLINNKMTHAKEEKEKLEAAVENGTCDDGVVISDRECKVFKIQNHEWITLCSFLLHSTLYAADSDKANKLGLKPDDYNKLYNYCREILK